MKTEWFVNDGKKIVGPVSVQELRSWAAQGRLKPFHRIRRQDSDRWVLASQVLGLFTQGSGEREIHAHPTGTLASSEGSSAGYHPGSVKIPSAGESSASHQDQGSEIPAPPVASIKTATLSSQKKPDVGLAEQAKKSKLSRQLWLSKVLLVALGAVLILGVLAVVSVRWWRSQLASAKGAHAPRGSQSSILHEAVERTARSSARSAGPLEVDGLEGLLAELDEEGKAASAASVTEEESKEKNAEARPATAATAGDKISGKVGASHWHNAASGPLEWGGVSVQLVEVALEQPRLLTQSGRRARPTTQFLIVRLELRPMGDLSHVSYKSWSDPYVVSEGLKLEDAQGRLFSPKRFPNLLVEGQIREASLESGGSVQDVLVFEPPSSVPTTLRLVLPASALGREGSFRFIIPPTMLVRKPMVEGPKHRVREVGGESLPEDRQTATGDASTVPRSSGLREPADRRHRSAEEIEMDDGGPIPIPGLEPNHGTESPSDSADTSSVPASPEK